MRDCIQFHSKIRPDDIAVIDLSFNRTWTYRSFNRMIDTFACILLEKGVIQGDRIVCLAKNRAEVPALHFACSRIGAIFVPLNWRLTLEELKLIIEDCNPRYLFVDQETSEKGLPGEDLEQLFFEEYSELSIINNPVLQDDIPSLILYTSGTSGFPKGVILSEKNLDETAINFALLSDIHRASSFLCEAPMFHIIGLITSIRPVLFFGGKIIISDHFIPQNTLRYLSDSKLNVTHYLCVPQMAKALRQEPDFSPALLRNLKAIITGGSPHPKDDIQEWLDDGIHILEGYGMSEAGTILGMPVNMNILKNKVGYTGLTTHRLQIRLTDDTGQVITEHQIAGELQVKGPNIMQGYWNKKDEFSAAHTDDGWFKTGDIGLCDDDGYFRIIDRKKDMYISGGENIYPSELELVVKKYPGVDSCVVVGVPDIKWGEVGCLYVVLDKKSIHPPSTEKINLFLEKYLARYKLPKYIYYLDELPRNAAGKVLKDSLIKQHNSSLKDT
ncbi:MAG: Long-chain-fatty-acid--CoA ligase FadD13 [Candidatus Celerinatantimonas neptuna]|nr:MAG: Long-chain-fatty-acid--CoA ligase FadD13 [Candidatus Celerinatantimonas neptuna]